MVRTFPSAPNKVAAPVLTSLVRARALQKKKEDAARQASQAFFVENSSWVSRHPRRFLNWAYRVHLKTGALPVISKDIRKRFSKRAVSVGVEVIAAGVQKTIERRKAANEAFQRKQEEKWKEMVGEEPFFLDWRDSKKRPFRRFIQKSGEFIHLDVLYCESDFLQRSSKLFVRADHTIKLDAFRRDTLREDQELNYLRACCIESLQEGHEDEQRHILERTLEALKAKKRLFVLSAAPAVRTF